MILASFESTVGTLWWSILMACAGFAAGMYFRPYIMKVLNKNK